MDKYRIYHSIRLLFCPAGIRRAEYLKDNNIFSSFGDNCSVMLWKIPLYPKLIKIGDNVKIASKDYYRDEQGYWRAFYKSRGIDAF